MDRHEVLRHVPNALSITRLILAVPAFILISGYVVTGEGLPATLAVLAAVVATDQLDGRIARRLDCCTRLGASLDVTADIAFACSGILALAVADVTPYILLVAMLCLFATFALTCADTGKVVYDRLGKAVGILCMSFPTVAVLTLSLGIPTVAVFYSGCILAAMTFVAFEFKMASAFLAVDRPASCRSLLVPPHHADYEGDGLAGAVRELVLDPDRRVGDDLSGDDAVGLQVLKPRRKRGARYPVELPLDLVEPHPAVHRQEHQDGHGPLAREDPRGLQRPYQALGRDVILALYALVEIRNADHD